MIEIPKKYNEGFLSKHTFKTKNNRYDLRIGEGDDVAAIARFLLTEESSWITGQIIGVDGGRSRIA